MRIESLPRSRFGVAAVLVLGLTLASACGSSDENSDTASTPAISDRGTGSSKTAGDQEAPLDPNRSYGGAKPQTGNAGVSSASPQPSTLPTVSLASSTVVDAGTRALPDAATVAVNPFVEANKDPFSTFGADVDTASYDYLRQSLQTYSMLPQPEYVRVEDYVNFFKYAYPVPAPDAVQPFAISLAASAHPMGRSTTLLRVGIQAKAAPAAESKGANLVFLVDVSGSMASPDKLPLVQRVLEESLGVLAPTDKVSIVTYAGDTKVRLAPTSVSSRDAITSVVKGLQAGGGTNGASGINLAYEQASAGFIEGGINHIVLCTDGDFNIGVSSNDALVELIKQKRATGVTLTALGFGHGNLNDAMMERVSNAGNGSYSIVFSEDQAVQYANQRLLSTIVHVAKDMKIQVEFNPSQVLAYRLLGYEDRAIADVSFRDDRVDGGEVGAEHRVTALYELVLLGGTLPTGAGVPSLSAGETSDVAREVLPGELVRVKVRSKPVTATDADPASEVVSALLPSQLASAPDQDLAWAAAVASFAEILRKSPYVVPGELDAVERIASSQKDRDGERAEFVSLVASARALLSK
ncbi:MAG: von Willebrand factor [Myxococcaceae bacterium]|nr:von Willebrand factor [Myxococcaceae bacterium]